MYDTPEKKMDTPEAQYMKSGSDILQTNVTFRLLYGI